MATFEITPSPRIDFCSQCKKEHGYHCPLDFKDVMIDIETMGTRSTAMIVQIGACYFNRETGEIGKEFLVNTHAVDDNFTVDHGTLTWWLEQSEEARMSITDISMGIDIAVERLSFFLEDAKYLWSHATFDIPILLHAFDVYKWKFPIHYSKMRDIRTLMDLADHRGTKEREGIHHNALDDCKYQVGYCVEAMNKLYGK